MSGSYPKPNTKAMNLTGTVLAFSLVQHDSVGAAATDDLAVKQAGAGTHTVGVCQGGGTVGQAKEIDLPGGGSLLQISATVTKGQWLKSDGSGYGTPGTTDGDFCPVQALASGVTGDVIPVFVHPIIITAAE